MEEGGANKTKKFKPPNFQCLFANKERGLSPHPHPPTHTLGSNEQRRTLTFTEVGNVSMSKKNSLDKSKTTNYPSFDESIDHKLTINVKISSHHFN